MMLTVRKYRIVLLAAIFVFLTVYFFADSHRDLLVDPFDAIRKVGYEDARKKADGQAQIPHAEIPVAPRPVIHEDAPQTTQKTEPPRAHGENVVVPDMDAALPTKPNMNKDEEKEKQDPLGGKWVTGPDQKTSKTGKTTKANRKPGSERYPVASKDLIALPTGKPKPLPKIQFAFKPETATDKADRVRKQAIVLDAFEHAWSGYKKFAMGCDELKPLSKTCANQTQFMGWGATLVDTLDTLWIMGLRDEFENAVKHIEKIDFTTSTSEQIPVFETTIRYLGGLLSAHDLSAGKYPVLLEKAIQLADVLMGAFDSPNRMPIPYYYWAGTEDPDFLISSRKTVLAELGSLSMEFTRLAQLTKKDKYYDAIARVTNALEKWQGETRMPGLWPLRLDSSGCKLKPAPVKDTKAKEAPPSVKNINKDAEITEEGVIIGEKNAVLKSHDWDGSPEKKAGGNVAKRQLDEPSVRLNKRAPSSGSDCEPQGLRHEPNPRDGKLVFGIGGLADSVYEYMPKMHGLLGGLNTQYHGMYDYAMKVIRDTLLFRPMIPDEKRSILFAARQEFDSKDPKSGKVTVWEATHLTCFAGGMIGLASRIFDNPKDLDLAKKLTDGCIWAYESTPAGVMPETFNVMACDSQTSCPWDEKKWHQFLDFGMQERFEATESWNKYQQSLYSKAPGTSKNAKSGSSGKTEGGDLDTKKKAESGSKKSTDDAAADSAEPPTKAKADDVDSTTNNRAKFGAKKPVKDLGKTDTDDDDMVALQKTPKKPSTAAQEDGKNGDTDKALGRRAIDDVDEEKPTKKGDTKLAEKPTKASSHLFEDDEEADGTKSGTPLTFKPKVAMSHEKFIEMTLAENRFPPGYTSIFDRAYKLRPEAIESVFIMWRLTGESYWREKGWQMFEAVQRATQTEVGNAQLLDVTSLLEPKKDSMESFWMAETLKYFYLLFSEPELVSLDDYVLNTEAHPFKIPK